MRHVYFVVFRVQKLLAASPLKQLVVDSFKLPSGCICGLKVDPFGFQSGHTIRKRNSQTSPPVCTSESARMGLKTFPNSLNVS